MVLRSLLGRGDLAGRQVLLRRCQTQRQAQLWAALQVALWEVSVEARPASLSLMSRPAVVICIS
jgi:hypothetical protein